MTRFVRSALLLALALPASAAAQAPPPLPKAREFTSNLFFVNKTGNSSITTVGADGKLILRPGWRWTHTEQTRVAYGKNDGEVSVENYMLGHRTEMALTGRVGLFGQIEFVRDRFKGLAAVYTYSIGLTAQIFSAPWDVISLEAGVGRVNQRNTTGVIQNFNSGRAAVVYRHTFKANTYFEETAELLPNLDDSDDLRMTSQSSLVAPISSHIGLKASYRIEYDHQPQPGFVETDGTFTTGLQVTF